MRRDDGSERPQSPPVEPAAVQAPRESPLERYIRILEVLASFPEGASAGEISRYIGLPRASAHRLLKTLQDSGLAEVSPPRKFVLGERMRRLAFVGAELNFLEAVVRPPLRELAEDVGETSNVGKLEANRIMMALMESPTTPWHGFVVQGQELPPHAAATAKAILAYQPKEVIDRILPDELPVLSRLTQTSKAALITEHAAIRRQGYASCNGEITEELIGIAVPIRIEGYPVSYSLGINGPRSRLSDDVVTATVGKLHLYAERFGEILSRHLGR